MNNSKPLFIALDMIEAWQLMDCRGEAQWGGSGMLWFVAYDQSPPIKPPDTLHYIIKQRPSQ